MKLCKVRWNCICDGGKTRDSARTEGCERSGGCAAGTHGCGGTRYGIHIARTDGDVSGTRGGIGRCST